MEGNLIPFSKITYKFTLWPSNPTSKNLSQWFDGKNPERHTHKTIHYSTICKSNTGSNLNDHRYETGWITHHPPIQWSTILSLQKNEEDPNVLLEVISLQAVKWGKEGMLSFIWGTGERKLEYTYVFIFFKKWQMKNFLKSSYLWKREGTGWWGRDRIFWIYLFWDLALKPYKYFM